MRILPYIVGKLSEVRLSKMRSNRADGKRGRVMEIMNKIGVIMVVSGMLLTVLGIIVQILAMALEEIW